MELSDMLKVVDTDTEGETNLETDPVIAVGPVLARKLYGQIIPIVDRPATNL